MADEQLEDFDDATSLIQVSISRQQSRLVSPRTPTLDKLQALQSDRDYFYEPDHSFEDAEDTSLDPPAAIGTTIQPYTASTAGYNRQKFTTPQSNDARTGLGDILTTRNRASSGPERAFANFQRAISSFPQRFSSSQQHDHTLQREYSNDTVQELPVRPHLDRLRSGSSLRRSISDDSLAVTRSFSQASSLGDDSRFEHIQNQVNSRFKAIRDSWQDTNIKIPSLSSLPEIFRSQDNMRSSLASLKPDFLRGAPSRSTKPIDPITMQPLQSLGDISDLKRGGHSLLDQALLTLEGDVIVLGGYRGSILRSAKPPHKQLWVPIKVGLNLRKVDLEVGIEEEDDHKQADNVFADGMLKHIGPVDMSARLLRRLRGCANAQSGRLRVHDYGYDWRLDPTFLSRQLCEYIGKIGTKVTVIAHSLGGLITRHAVNNRPELFAGVLYAGVPTRCVNILGPLRNGDDVLLSSRVLTAQVNFTIRTSFALLPLDGRCFIDKQTREEYRIDFFDPDTWREYRLSPCISRSLPSLKTENFGIASYVSSVAKSLPSLPSRRSSIIRSKPGSATALNVMTEPGTSAMTSNGGMDSNSSQQTAESGTLEAEQPTDPTVGTVVTIPPEKAYQYLSRTLANIKRFKQELAFRPGLADLYPSTAAIYGKNTPTVIGAKVDGRDGIRRADAYEDLAFASGDGVVLARAAMPPKGYTVVKGGLISSERGHVSLLADLDAVGKALSAIADDQRRRAGSSS